MPEPLAFAGGSETLLLTKCPKVQKTEAFFVESPVFNAYHFSSNQFMLILIKANLPERESESFDQYNYTFLIASSNTILLS